jgi:hypothetical protein
VLLQGAAETTAAILQTFILAIVMFPEAQRKAQQELDRVVGPNRTPVIEDLENLPYVRAVLDEVSLLNLGFILVVGRALNLLRYIASVRLYPYVFHTQPHRKCP